MYQLIPMKSLWPSGVGTIWNYERVTDGYKKNHNHIDVKPNKNSVHELKLAKKKFLVTAHVEG